MIDTLQHIVLNTAALILTLGILVTIHEYGHFWVARRCGVKVERFSIGYGKPLLRWMRGETEYVIAALPLGGYVRMLGEPNQASNPSDSERAFSSKSLGKRTAIIAAGPVANFLLAIVLYWMMFVVGVSEVAPVIGRVIPDSTAEVAGLQVNDEIIAVDGKATETWQHVYRSLVERLGESGDLLLRVKNSAGNERNLTLTLNSFLAGQQDPNPLSELGMVMYRLDYPARLGDLRPDGRAEAAGLQSGDLVVAVNGESVQGWGHWVEIIQGNPETAMDVTVDRNGAEQNVEVTPALTDAGTGLIGAEVMVPDVVPEFPEWMNREIRYSPLEAIPRAVEETWATSVLILDSLKKMVVGLISVKNLSGPITIAQVAGETVSYGLEYFLGFLAMLSITLGVMNLLPIPVLDGGHLLYNLVEFLIRRPVPEKFQQWGMQFGLLLIIGFTFIAFYNDFNRLL